MSTLEQRLTIHWRAVKLLERGYPEFDPSQPRDEDGKFTDAGGGGDKPDVTLEPHVIDVGGDEWNKATARRLEREYQTVRPLIEKLEQAAVGGETESESDEEEEEPPYKPEEWDALSASDQEEAEGEWKSKYKDDYYQSEYDNWQSEQAPDDARYKVAQDWTDGSEEDWVRETLAEVREQRKGDGLSDIPYSDLALLKAITIEHETGYYPISKGTTIKIDDAKLEPDLAANQMPLPLGDAPPPVTQLTDEMREDLIDALNEAFDEEAERVVEKLEAPDYLADSANEMLGEVWDQMSDDDKFKFVEDSTDILKKYEEDAPAPDSLVLDRLPSKYDPLNTTSGADYKLTQALARILSLTRMKQVLAERGLPVPPDHELREIDTKLWHGWKESSTSEDGKLLQLATADELGGRLNAVTRSALNPEEQRARAERRYSAIGGYNGVKAMVRAKWEVSQYLLDKGDHDELKLYRGINLKSDVVQKRLKHLETSRNVNDHTHMPTLDVMRNGAASTSLKASVANGWGASDNRVVLRVAVPRTAAISIPAYGINVQSEQEVVVAGTAWHGWDAWARMAPTFEDVPLQQAT